MPILTHEPRAKSLPVSRRDLDTKTIDRHIVSAGFELEVGINESGREELIRYVQDRGLEVFYRGERDGGFNVPGREIGNFEIRFYSTNLMVLADFLRYAYNQCGVKTNESCGFHVHIAFGDLATAISVFSSDEVRRDFERRYRERFDGKRYMQRFLTKHCRSRNIDQERRLSPEGDIIANKDSAINVGAYTRGTIEFRILPNQLSAGEAVESLEWMIGTASELYAKHKDDIPYSLISLSEAIKAVQRVVVV